MVWEQLNIQSLYMHNSLVSVCHKCFYDKRFCSEEKFTQTDLNRIILVVSQELLCMNGLEKTSQAETLTLFEQQSVRRVCNFQFSQQSYYRYKCFGTWCCVLGRVLSGILKGPMAQHTSKTTWIFMLAEVRLNYRCTVLHFDTTLF